MGKEDCIDKFLATQDLKAEISKMSFEQLIKSLEELVVSVEAGALPLEKAVKSYEVGSLMVEQLRSLLSGAETKLQVLERERNKG